MPDAGGEAGTYDAFFSTLLKDYTDGWDAFVAGSELPSNASADFKKGYRAARFASANPKPGAHTHQPGDIPHVHPEQGHTGLPTSPPKG